ncbi:MAG: hypothetical protein ACD_10C00905G0003 [uncultured bacterium]|nr:MAG: hypothetical protein ACD_10C00905G0003 [uncultured bacterium]
MGDLIKIEWGGGGFGGDVKRLAQNHALRARGFGKACNQGKPGFGAAKGRVGQQIEGQRLQRVTGQNRGGLIPFDMHGRQAAAQRVVVHRGQVVVDERIGVQRLDRGGGRDRGFRTQAQHAGGFQRQKPAQAFAARAGIGHGVDHGLIRQGGKGGVETGLDQRGVGGQQGGKAHIPSTGEVDTARPSAARISSTFSSALASLAAQWAFSAAPRS